MNKNSFYWFFGIVFLLVIWFVISFFNIVNSLFLPSPIYVISAFFKLFFNGKIISDIVATLSRMFFGFLIAVIIGVPLGILMGYFNKVYLSLEFIIDFFRSIPATALIPLFLLFFGIGEGSKIFLVGFVCALIIIVNTMYGVHNSNKLRVLVAKSMGASKSDILTKVVLPDGLPYISAGIRVALSLSLIIVIVSEMFIGTYSGLGYRILNAQLVFNTKELYALILLTGLLGYCINKLYVLFEKKVIHWSGK